MAEMNWVEAPGAAAAVAWPAIEAPETIPDRRGALPDASVARARAGAARPSSAPRPSSTNSPSTHERVGARRGDRAAAEEEAEHVAMVRQWMTRCPAARSRLGARPRSAALHRLIRTRDGRAAAARAGRRRSATPTASRSTAGASSSSPARWAGTRSSAFTCDQIAPQFEQALRNVLAVLARPAAQARRHLPHHRLLLRQAGIPGRAAARSARSGAA